MVILLKLEKSTESVQHCGFQDSASSKDGLSNLDQLWGLSLTTTRKDGHKIKISCLKVQRDNRQWGISGHTGKRKRFLPNGWFWPGDICWSWWDSWRLNKNFTALNVHSWSLLNKLYLGLGPQKAIPQEKRGPRSTLAFLWLKPGFKMKPSRILWDPPGHKILSVSLISCL